MAEVSEPGLAVLGFALSVEVVEEVDELVLWSASMLPVVLVPVAVFASGVVVVVPETDVSFVG
ncbi:MAG TPA: hypothetical protein VFX69_07700 [Steroidobacteraceae bacterium]|nr:hypothetical protein [Steroidobacteraceae bacterium]